MNPTPTPPKVAGPPPPPPPFPRPHPTTPLLAFLLVLLLPTTPTPATTRPLTPAEARTAFATDPDLTVDLVAAEPLVISPAAFAWDEHARLMVAENPGYPIGPRPGEPPIGSLTLLTDTNHDGTADTRTVFATGLGFPNGLLPWRGGWLVTDAPNLLWLADTNHDGHADVREIWFTGFATNQTTQLRACYPTLAPDGWIHIARGLSAGSVSSPKWPHLPAVDLKHGDFRFRPDGSAAETIGGNAQFGLVLDDANRRFLVSNRNPLMHAVVHPRFWQRHPGLPFTDLVHDVSPSGYEARVFPRSPDTTTAGFMPEFMAAPHAGSFTAACGIHQFFGPALRPGDQGAWFVCEPAQNLVQRQIPTPAGPTFSSRPSPADRDFLTSSDPWFRPVFASTGPDGALYLADLYRKIIDHPAYLPEGIRDTLDYNAGKDMGRIWRIRSSHAPPPTRPRSLASTTVTERITALSDPNLWIRQTAHRLLLEHPNPGELLKPLVDALTPDLPLPTPPRDGSGEGWGATRLATDPINGPHLGLTRRLWMLATSLQQTLANPRKASDISNQAHHLLLCATFHPSPTVRETAWRISLARTPDPKHALPDVPYDLIAWWADDPSPAVRFQVALACGDQDDWSPVLPALAHIARLDATNRWTRAAILSGLRHREFGFLQELLRQPLPDTPAIADLLHDYARITDATPGGAGVHLLATALNPAHAEAAWPLAVLQGLSTSLRNAGGPSLSTFLWLTHALSEPSGRPLPDLFEATGRRAIATARNPKASAPRRIASLEFLAELDLIRLPEVLDTLTATLAPDQPQDLRLAAIRTLGRIHHPDVGPLLATKERWTSDPPALRDAALAALTSRPDLLPALFDALERGDAPVWIVDPKRRRQLQNHTQPALRDRARKLFANTGGEDRRKVFESLKPVLAQPASGTRGRAVFTRTCANCHTLDGEGVRVGPDLSGLRNQPAEAILLHIVIPDAEIYPGYQACEVETRDGRSLSGLLIAETPDTVVLRRAGGEQDTLPRSNIASFTLSRMSLMPQELEKSMTRQDLADLLARLRGQP